MMSQELGMCLSPLRYKGTTRKEISVLNYLQNLFFLLNFGKCNQIFRGLKKKKKKQPEAISDPPELDVRFWASQCISVLLLFLYGLYCDTALGI